MRARLIGIGIISIFVAMALQIESDATATLTQRPSASPGATLSLKAVPIVSPAMPTPDLIFIPEQTGSGGLSAYDPRLNRLGPSLGRGLPSGDGTLYFTADSERGGTVIETHSLTDGRLEHVFRIDGAWNLESVSASGRWLALTRSSTGGGLAGIESREVWKTEVDVVEPAKDRIAHSLTLEGNLSAEAVTDANLLLVEHTPAADPTQDLIRLYDLERGKSIPIKDAADGVAIPGTAADHVGSPDGRLLLTLYGDGRLGRSFLQAVDLVNRYLVRIDLPAGAGGLENYSLAMSPQRGEVYAVSPGSGTLTVVNLNGLDVSRTMHFSPMTKSMSVDPASKPPRGSTLVSADGERLFAAWLNEIWAFDLMAGKMTDSYQVGSSVLGLSANRSANRLYALTSGATVRVFIVPINGTLVPLN